MFTLALVQLYALLGVCLPRRRGLDQLIHLLRVLGDWEGGDILDISAKGSIYGWFMRGNAYIFKIIFL